MNRNISSRDDVRSTVRSDVSKADKLDTTVKLSSSDEWNAAPSRIIEGRIKRTDEPRELLERS